MWPSNSYSTPILRCSAQITSTNSDPLSPCTVDVFYWFRNWVVLVPLDVIGHTHHCDQVTTVTSLRFRSRWSRYSCLANPEKRDIKFPPQRLSVQYNPKQRVSQGLTNTHYSRYMLIPRNLRTLCRTDYFSSPCERHAQTPLVDSKIFHEFAAGVSICTRVGAILRRLVFFCSSGSDSEIPPTSLFPRLLSLIELALLPVARGVIGGVLKGTPVGAELVAATLGTLPNVGVGLLPTNPAMCVVTDDVEFERLGLGGRPLTPTDDPTLGLLILVKAGALMAVGVGTGEGWAELETEIARADGWGWCEVGTSPV